MATDTLLTRPPDTRRYWMGVFLLLLLLLVASVGLAWTGRQPRVRARAVLPAPASTVSVYPALEVQFVGPVDKGSVEGNVRIEPEVPFTLAWRDQRLRILPQGPLRAESEYAVTIGPGLLDLNGNALVGEIAWRFRTRAPRVAFVRFAEQIGELWMSDLAGTTPQRLSAPGQSVQAFDAAPDGTRVVYTVHEGQDNAVSLWYALDEGRGFSRLAAEPGVVFGDPRFSPGGELLAVEARPFVQLADQGTTLGPPRLELRRPTDGSPAGEIYGGGGEVGHSPRWAPDGTRLAFFEAAQNRIGLFNFTPDVRFYPGEGVQLSEQGWSPDGRVLLYATVQVEEQGARGVLALRDVEMGTDLRLADVPGDQSDPVWSPDGSWIAYAYRPPPGQAAQSGIWLVRPDGSDRTPLVTDPAGLFSLPLWSPDGEWLLFGRFDAAGGAGEQAVWAVRRDGSEAHPVATDAFLHGWVP